MNDIIYYRYYQSGDEQEIVQLWNDSVAFDPVTAKRFRDLVLLDANFDSLGLRIAFDGKKMIGCVYAVRRLLPMYGTDLEPDNGWIPFFFVHPKYRKLGVGTNLMVEAVDFLRKEGRSNIFFASYAPNYILPGIDERVYPEAYSFLLKQGFEQVYSPIAMDIDLVGFQMPEDIAAITKQRELEGYTFTTAQDSDLYEAIQFASEEFNPDWGRAIREGILRGLPMNRILIARQKNELVGFCIYGAYERIPERFGPFGVSETQQGKGLGKIILNKCLQLMRAEGLHSAWFLWTGEKTAAGHLYKKTGFEVTRTFHVMRKNVTE